MKTFARKRCRICGQVISTAGFAWAGHMRKHVRNGEAVERHYRIGKREHTIFEATGKKPGELL